MLGHLILVHGDETIVLFVHINVLNKALADKIVKSDNSISQLLQQTP